MGRGAGKLPFCLRVRNHHTCLQAGHQLCCAEESMSVLPVNHQYNRVACLSLISDQLSVCNYIKVASRAYTFRLSLRHWGANMPVFAGLQSALRNHAVALLPDGEQSCVIMHEVAR